MNPKEELKASVKNLEFRVQVLGVPTKIETFEALSSFTEEEFPAWWKECLTNHSVVNAALEYRAQEASYVQTFGIMGAEEYFNLIKEDHLKENLWGCGWFPVGAGDDGDLWVVSMNEGVLSPVYLLEHSAWDGSAPSEENGLVFAAARLSYLLLSMGISEVAYYREPHGPSRVIWYPDRTPDELSLSSRATQ
tara:strand:+ start:97 stop:672 length:576 start_codon:yes stop_codon:yes gene_type:complete